MSKVVLDASALLALINQEPGHEIVEDKLPYAIMPTVNVSEVMTVLTHAGAPIDEIKPIVFNLIPEIIPFGKIHAVVTAKLRHPTKTRGLSFGDRSCLALASELGFVNC